MTQHINHILCPVDLSDVSRLAIEHAVLIAGWYNARVTALHVCNPIVIPSADFMVFGYGTAPTLTDDEVEQAREQILACFKSAKSIDVDVIIDTGHPAHRILACATSLPADLIVVGTHGTGGFEHLVLGSVTEKVLRKATCPVMTVPPHARTTSTLPFKRLLCPIDFSEPSLRALEFALSLAQEADAELTILHVFEWPVGDELLAARPFTVPEFRQQCERDAAQKLHELVPQSAREWCRPTTRLAHGKAYREILRIAADVSADAIVMGVHGRNALDLMLFGSTTNQVVRLATCPVVTLRA